MKENFFKIGYSKYFNEKEKKDRTSYILRKILKHKIIYSILLIIICCITANILLIYKFLLLLEKNISIY